MQIARDLAKLVERLRAASHVTVLTGAGISTASGIPDFRGINRINTDLSQLTSTFMRRQPAKAYEVLRPLIQTILAATPNAAHIALARLLAKGVLRGLLTQNIDGLHSRAGTGVVWELHGNLYRGYCMECRTEYDMNGPLVAFLQSGQLPTSACCGAVLRPDIVLFGDKLPMETWRQAERLARASDLMLVIGSTLEVAPACYLPELSRETAIINVGPTAMDHKAILKIECDAITGCKYLLRHLA